MHLPYSYKMSKSFKSILQLLIGLIVASVFLYFTLHNKDLSEIWAGLRTADPAWMAFSFSMLLIVFYLKAERWKILLENSGMQVKFTDILNSVVFGYFVNSFTPKFGEIMRCTNIKRTHDYKFSQLFGSGVSERIWDVLILGVGVLIVGLFELDKFWEFFLQIGSSTLEGGSASWPTYLYLAIAVIAMAGFFFLFRKKLMQVAIIQRLVYFVQEVVQTVLLTFQIKKYPRFLLLTFLIWFLLILMNYGFLQALSLTAGYSFYFAAVTLFIGGIGWALPAPGGIGTTHWFILQLFLVFGLSEQAGLSFGILSNGLNFLYIVATGIVFWIVQEIRIIRLRKHNSLPLNTLNP